MIDWLIDDNSFSISAIFANASYFLEHGYGQTLHRSLFHSFIPDLELNFPEIQ